MDKIFKSLADKQRRIILSLLKDTDMSVSEILKHLSIKQATLSSHLAILKKAGLVFDKVDGKRRIYKLNKEVFDLFVKELNRFASVRDEKIENEIILRRKTS